MRRTRPGQVLRAAIYARISSDREGKEQGVDRQIEDCRRLAADLGYEVAGEFVDNDLSASTRSKKPRPAYNEMMRLAQSGRFDAVLAYSNSRLTRRVREYLDLIDLDEHAWRARQDGGIRPARPQHR